MQASCPKCSHKVVVDDAKAPERAFSVKCPKCQTPVRFAGKVSAVPAAPAAATSPAAATVIPGAELPPSTSGAESGDMRAGMMAQLRREMGIAPGGGEASMRALIAVPDAGLTAALSQNLTRLGYAIDTVDEAGDALRLVEQGVYSVVVTTKSAGAGGKETLLQRVGRLNPEGRRKVFLVLAGDEFKTGDGTQAFAAMADLVVGSHDTAGVEAALKNTLAERTRLYQMFTDARRRFEASAG